MARHQQRCVAQRFNGAGLVSDLGGARGAHNQGPVQQPQAKHLRRLRLPFRASVDRRIDAAITSRMASFAQPTGFLAAIFPGTVASPTNITAATGVTLAAVTHTGAVIPTVTTVTGLAASDVAAIKAKTDSLNFTVAGVVNANTLRIAGTTIVGNGVAPKFGV